MTNQSKIGFLALAKQGQTLFFLAWPIIWHQRQGFKFTTELTRIVEIQNITYSGSL